MEPGPETEFQNEKHLSLGIRLYGLCVGLGAGIGGGGGVCVRARGLRRLILLSEDLYFLIKLPEAQSSLNIQRNTLVSLQIV